MNKAPWNQTDRTWHGSDRRGGRGGLSDLAISDSDRRPLRWPCPSFSGRPNPARAVAVTVIITVFVCEFLRHPINKKYIRDSVKGIIDHEKLSRNEFCSILLKQLQILALREQCSTTATPHRGTFRVRAITIDAYFLLL